MKWKGKWRSEKWKFLIQGNYSKKACSCEQDLEIVCGKVAIVTRMSFNKRKATLLTRGRLKFFILKVVKLFLYCDLESVYLKRAEGE